MIRVIIVCCIALGAMATTSRADAGGKICFKEMNIGAWGIRADDSNWKIFRRYNYVNFLSVFDDNISMIAHPKLPGIIEVTLNGKPIVRHPKSRVT